jgi:hypothetical protein
MCFGVWAQAASKLRLSGTSRRAGVMKAPVIDNMKGG